MKSWSSRPIVVQRLSTDRSAAFLSRALSFENALPAELDHVGASDAQIQNQFHCKPGLVSGKPWLILVPDPDVENSG
ncbi:hypothetical protein A8M32_19485 [Sinorhizobium alkalisoli]|uniref:Uncharacterized protein n=1 Tax=Sinorhizobium alkalisoli TaxID=1752398 RepID=A0A1E3V8S5_9HYPH|nr:hypothetical protein A8M32_19485 [Sinorhizobium alkalisoli]